MNQLIFDIETSGLDFNKDFVSCIGFFSPQFGVCQFARKDTLIEDCDSWLSDFVNIDEWELVGFNSKNFDLPFLREQGLKNLDQFKHVDLMPIMSKSMRADDWKKCLKKGEDPSSKIRVHKDSACYDYDIYVPKHSTGGAAARRAKRGLDEDIMEICKHNAIDLFATWELWQEAVNWKLI